MLGERVRKLRIEKGLSQEALADRLHVVRQTVSKWEKGFSVPDADLLQRLADVFDVPLEELLGATETETTDLDLISKKLSSISEELSIRNRRLKRFIKVILGTILIVFVLTLIILLLGMKSRQEKNVPPTITASTEIKQE